MKKLNEDIPSANVIFLESSGSELCKMKLQKTDKSTHSYFKIGYTESKPHLINYFVAAGRDIFD